MSCIQIFSSLAVEDSCWVPLANVQYVYNQQYGLLVLACTIIYYRVAVIWSHLRDNLSILCPQLEVQQRTSGACSARVSAFAWWKFEPVLPVYFTLPNGRSLSFRQRVTYSFYVLVVDIIIWQWRLCSVFLTTGVLSRFCWPIISPISNHQTFACLFPVPDLRNPSKILCCSCATTAWLSLRFQWDVQLLRKS